MKPNSSTKKTDLVLINEVFSGFSFKPKEVSSFEWYVKYVRGHQFDFVISQKGFIFFSAWDTLQHEAANNNHPEKS